MPSRSNSGVLDRVANAFLERLRSVEWRWLHGGPHAGRWNMERDQELLHAAAEGTSEPVLRFYTWDPPALSLGRFQNEDGINLPALERRGWDLVRRPTGGRAVLHHLELTYSLVLPPEVVDGVGIRTSYTVLAALLNAGLRRLLPTAEPVPGPACNARTREPNCFALASECDTLVPGGKLVGSAQARHRGAMLQHGSILLDADRNAWTEILGSAGRLTTMRDLLRRTPAVEEVALAIRDGFTEMGIRLSPGAP
jgi:lipoate-protein ligase A